MALRHPDQFKDGAKKLVWPVTIDYIESMQQSLYWDVQVAKLGQDAFRFPRIRYLCKVKGQPPGKGKLVPGVDGLSGDPQVAVPPPSLRPEEIESWMNEQKRRNRSREIAIAKEISTKNKWLGFPSMAQQTASSATGALNAYRKNDYQKGRDYYKQIPQNTSWHLATIRALGLWTTWRATCAGGNALGKHNDMAKIAVDQVLHMCKDNVRAKKTLSDNTIPNDIAVTACLRDAYDILVIDLWVEKRTTIGDLSTIDGLPWTDVVLAAFVKLSEPNVPIRKGAPGYPSILRDLLTAEKVTAPSARVKTFGAQVIAASNQPKRKLTAATSPSPSPSSSSRRPPKRGKLLADQRKLVSDAANFDQESWNHDTTSEEYFDQYPEGFGERWRSLRGCSGFKPLLIKRPRVIGGSGAALVGNGRRILTAIWR